MKWHKFGYVLCKNLCCHSLYFVLMEDIMQCSLLIWIGVSNQCNIEGIILSWSTNNWCGNLIVDVGLINLFDGSMFVVFGSCSGSNSESTLISCFFLLLFNQLEFFQMRLLSTWKGSIPSDQMNEHQSGTLISSFGKTS